MKEYISHYTAAYRWKIPYLHIIFDAELKKKNKDINLPHITVSNSAKSYNRKNLIVHSCELDLPRGAVRKCGTDLVASPEYTFLQLSNFLDIHRLILLGIAMCSHPPGKPDAAISSPRKLRDFLNKTTGFNGHQLAMRALLYIKGGAASPMEILSFMLLTLPHSLGGYGLSGAEFNTEIVLNKNSRYILEQNRCFADIYYPTEKIDVEYDSEERHSEQDKLNKDMLRATVLESMGIDMARLGKSQVYDKKAFYEFAQNLASRLGKRIRIRSEKFTMMNKKLRNLLYTK